jgi:hypothetical protein
MTLKCLRIEVPNNNSWNDGSGLERAATSGNISLEDSDKFTALVHRLDKCDRYRFQCIRVQRLRPGLLQLDFDGDISDFNSRCSGAFISTAPITTTSNNNSLLIAAAMMSQRAGRCPFKGRFTGQLDDVGCQLQMYSSCEHTDQMDIVSTCQSRPIVQLVCLVWWRHHSSTYLLLARRTDVNESMLVCYSIQRHESQISVSATDRCLSQDSTSPRHLADSFVIHKPLKEKCHKTPTSDFDDFEPQQDTAGAQTERRDVTVKTSVGRLKAAVSSSANARLCTLLQTFLLLILYSLTAVATALS